ncbi:hypothetical protein BJ165DRAFT_189732 [Panaeolus papilionaceus]|nr:hypothetical protein BJ165DRAFT_189732 [Panaeolus papilionaceus]
MLLIAFLVDTLPRQIYLHLLLRLPSLYFSRVSRIFLEAEVTMPEIKQGVLHDAQHFKTQGGWFPEPYLVSPCYQKLQSSWDAFIDSLLKEWKTLNIVSVLLLSAILTVLQLDGAADDPVTRFSALISMICALMSLLFGCMYIIRFGTMRKAHKAAEWAQEAQQTQTGIMWNVWIMLAMPAVWLAWSMLSYIICIMAFVWRTGTQGDSGGGVMSASDALAPRIVVSCILCLGLIYFILIASTLRRYGDLMDQAWQRRIQNWIYDQTAGPLGQGYGYQPPPRPLFSAGYTSRFAENVNSSHSARPKSHKRRKTPSTYGVPIANRSISAPVPPGNPTGDGVSEHSMWNILPRQPVPRSPADQEEKDIGHHAHYCADDHVAHIPQDRHSVNSANERRVAGEGEEAGQAESDPAIEFTRFCGLDSGDPEVTGTMYDKTVPYDVAQMRITDTEWGDIYKVSLNSLYYLTSLHVRFLTLEFTPVTRGSMGSFRPF